MTISLLAMTVTLLPYLYGYSISAGRHFMWLGYNLDDSCTYLAWMRQASDGAVVGFNLFTTDAQHGMILNPLFAVMGAFAGITHLPLIAVYHGARLCFGVLLLASVWLLCGDVLPPGTGHVEVPSVSLTACKPVVDRNALGRRMSFLFVAFSSGLGWLPLWWSDNPINTPIDKWQPEAITFLSLYLSPLFCFALTLQVLIVLFLYRADRTGTRKPAIVAGVCGFILGLVHTYDVVSLASVWSLYLIVRMIRPLDARERASTSASWLNALIAGSITLPAVAYIYLKLRTETVFQERAAVHTDTPSLNWILIGYGLTLILALFAIYSFAQKRTGEAETAFTEGHRPGNGMDIPPAAARLLCCWSIANLAVAYVPTSIQRKLLQGEHFPIAILAGIAGATLLGRLRLPVGLMRATPVALVLILGITNIRFMLRDAENFESNLAQTKQHRPFLKPGEIDALRWINVHVPREQAIQPLPYLAANPQLTQYGPKDMSVAAFAPGLTNHHVYCGHWGETPDYRHKLVELENFALPKTTDDERIALLHKMKVRYLIYSQKEATDDAADHFAPMFRNRVELPPYLKLVYQNPDADIYEINLPDQTRPPMRPAF